MMSYWHGVVKARAPVRAFSSLLETTETTLISDRSALQSLILWGVLQSGIIYTIYDQKKHEKYVSLFQNLFVYLLPLMISFRLSVGSLPLEAIDLLGGRTFQQTG